MDARNDNTGRDAGAAPDAGAGYSAEGDDLEQAWDADDERRQKDQFAPPREPCECYCLHCGRVFMSDAIWLQRVVGARDGFDGFWMCPTPNCGGSGFTFDIFPTDPDHPANEGWTYCDDEDEEDADGDDVEPHEWDPEEPEYKALDEAHGDDADEDLEGEEWKYGLQPGERPPEPKWVEEARRHREEEEKRYDAPDERPREVDWSGREEERGPRPDRDDDIPF